ncbi:bis(5'-nucleosyl)-tetraphosphatase (symmetrical) YqeK [Clostridium sp. MB40-C1]|uniref:bis(5'-nucleosyl)-tetraphosphatase (symmetrical) YqeK n=1 Tax=Clostridium sp. MB40-C1 TaxID=3070996 RepID=UPI0027DF1643|nr:bis(5'-nucleosyl)-tetraphosphatase (symmetrical) YqeK [Clostridium sp. MB40-C1]WMJ82334.1 bis(5'-nucleosyl)-tetraphosphatase (symmetrical) YqeK [Clostridium sp. MB40-C1]
MWTEDKIIQYLKENLKESRFKHSISVMETAVKLADIYGEDIEKAKIAGLVHDCAKYLQRDRMLSVAGEYGYDITKVCFKNSSLLHGAAGAYVAKNIIGIEDEDILNSITYHTTGRRKMSMLEKIIFIADYIEPLRDFPGVDVVRKMAYKDIDKSLIMAFDKTIKYVVEKGQLLHSDTVEARNYMICERYAEEI